MSRDADISPPESSQSHGILLTSRIARRLAINPTISVPFSVRFNHPPLQPTLASTTMFAQRTAARMSQRAAQQLRSAPRRFNSTGSGEKFPWAVDNSFNREREAVKHHANSTSGAFPSCPLL